MVHKHDTRNPCVNLRFPQIFSLNKGQAEQEIIEGDVWWFLCVSIFPLNTWLWLGLTCVWVCVRRAPVSMGRLRPGTVYSLQVWAAWSYLVHWYAGPVISYVHPAPATHSSPVQSRCHLLFSSLHLHWDLFLSLCLSLSHLTLTEQGHNPWLTDCLTRSISE